VTSDQASAEFLSKITTPAAARPINTIPVQGTGKVNYLGIGKMITKAA